MLAPLAASQQPICSRVCVDSAGIRPRASGPTFRIRFPPLETPFDELAQELARRFPGVVGGRVAQWLFIVTQASQGTVHPRVPHAFWWNDLFGRSEIARVLPRFASGDRTETLTRCLEAVVDDHCGLEGAHHPDELGGAPCLPREPVVGEVKPEDREFAIVAAQFPDLAVEIVEVAPKS